MKPMLFPLAAALAALSIAACDRNAGRVVSGGIDSLAGRKLRERARECLRCIRKISLRSDAKNICIYS